MKSIQEIAYVLVYEDDEQPSEKQCSCSRTVKGDEEKWRELFKSTMEKARLEIEDVVNPFNQKQHFILISADFDILATQAELMHLKVPLDDEIWRDKESPMYNYLLKAEEKSFYERWFPCCTKSMAEKMVQFVNYIFNTDRKKENSVARNFIYKDFDVYKGCKGDLNYFFRTSLRSLLVYSILIELDINDYLEELSLHPGYSCASGVMKRGLLFLRRRGIFIADFPLHEPSLVDLPVRSCCANQLPVPPKQEATLAVDSLQEEENDARLVLYNAWFRCPAWFQFQPFWRIRDYFGERIAFYFAWCGHLITALWIPSFVGTGVFGYGLYFSLQRHAVLNTMTTMTNLSEIDKVLTSSAAVFEDALAVIRESFDNDVTPWFALFICLWGTIFIETWRRRSARLAYEWDVNKYKLKERDRPEYRCKGSISHETTDSKWAKVVKYLISFVVLLFMIGATCLSVAGVIFFRIVATVDWLSAPEKEQYRFLVASILPPIMNGISSGILQMFYNRLALVLTRFENHRSQTRFDDALILKVFCFQFVNSYSSLFYIAFFQSLEYEAGIFGQGTRYLDTCGTDKNCMSQLSFQLLVMMFIGSVPKFFFDVILPIALRICRQCCQCLRRNVTRPHRGSINLRDEFIFGEFQKKNLTKLDDFALFEFSEKVIQYGYVMLFAASFPLAPVMALIADICDIRVDAWRLLTLSRRPVGFIAEDIGIWVKIIRFLSMAGVMTNAFLIAFTSQWGQKQTINNRFWIIIGFQNICIFLKFLLEFFIPSIPAELNTRKTHEKHWARERMKEFQTSAATKRKRSVKKPRKNGSTLNTKKQETLRKKRTISKDAEDNLPPPPPPRGVQHAMTKEVGAEKPNEKEKTLGTDFNNDSIRRGDNGATSAPRLRMRSLKKKKKAQPNQGSGDIVDALPALKHLPPIDRGVLPPQNQNSLE